nr:hypothetical protein JVH1_0224 [Rhodococcus sp. JVH1]
MVYARRQDTHPRRSAPDVVHARQITARSGDTVTRRTRPRTVPRAMPEPDFAATETTCPDLPLVREADGVRPPRRMV